jgi:hypothetical protein
MDAKEVPNELVVWNYTSSDDEHTGCDPLKRMVENALNNMDDNDNMEVPYLLPPIEGGGLWKQGGW